MQVESGKAWHGMRGQASPDGVSEAGVGVLESSQDRVAHSVALLLPVVALALLLACSCGPAALKARLIVVGVADQDHALNANQHLHGQNAQSDVIGL